MASWINDVQSKIFTIVSYKGKKEYQEKFPNIFYTTDVLGDGKTHYPTIYLKFLPSNEMGRSFDVDEISAYRCAIQIEVTVSNDDTQGMKVGQEIIWFTLQTLQKYGFMTTTTPEDVTMDSSNRRYVARVERVFGAGDYIG